jgi:hypothetical protein
MTAALILQPPRKSPPYVDSLGIVWYGVHVRWQSVDGRDRLTCAAAPGSYHQAETIALTSIRENT